MQPSPVSASVVITTRNRKDEVLRAIESCYAQRDVDLEVLVFDDASTDGTTKAVRERWPRVRLLGSEARVGLIVARNRGFHEARAGYVFSLDDDAYFAADDIVARTVAQLEGDPAIGAIAMPYIEPLARRSLSSLRSPLAVQSGDEVRSYVGCAHAVRRSVALELGGYREFFIHQGEERDLCLRMRDAGWRIVYGEAGPIVHLVSPNREPDRVNHFGARNQILFNWLNLPVAVLAGRMIWDSLAILRYRFSARTVPGRVRAIGAGLAESARRLRERRPVSWRAYRAYRSLPGHGPEEWDGPVPPPRTLTDCRPPSASSGIRP